MAQGQDRIASSLLELQPTAIIELFLLYFNTVDNPGAFIAFHGGSVYNQGVVWQGVEYLPIPVETDGFEVNANGQLARPKMRISNKDYFATDLLINNDDLQFAKIIRKRTFIKYLDDVNFDGGNPWSQADASAELSNDTFVVGQKTAENKTFIELELTSPLDLENFEINNRLIMSRYCSWHYRGNGCNYRGVPLATEEGERLTIADPQDWFTNQTTKAWSVQRAYNSGDVSYIENQKIIVSDPSNPSQTGFAKIWYVCQSGHQGSSLTIPDKNPSLWKRDGCNKKLDGCKLRFGKGNVEFNEVIVPRTAYFVDFTSRTGALRYNNIAPNAIVSGSSEIPGSEAIKTVDLINGAGSVWQAAGTASPGATLQFTFPSGRYINRIDIYSDPDINKNFNNAYITYFNTKTSANPSGSGVLPIVGGGERSTTGFVSKFVDKIIISGSGVSAASSLGEVAIFETITPAMRYNENFSSFTPPLPPVTTALHRNNFFQIATWIGIDYLNLYPNELYSVFHNLLMGGSCRHSGINLYISGQNFLLDFATRTTGAFPIETKRTLSIPWRAVNYSPLHLICSGGMSTGLAPTATTPGYIELTDGITQTSRFTLSNGEYFRFKNTSYQLGNLPGYLGFNFGINNWQFPTGNEFVPDPLPATNQIYSNMKLVSPIKFGTTVFWTGGDGVNVRIDDFNKSILRSYADFTGRSSNTADLLGYWNMSGSGTAGNVIPDPRDRFRQLTISGLAAAEGAVIQQSIVNPVTTGDLEITQFLDVAKQNIALPFGGFPGTEKYG